MRLLITVTVLYLVNSSVYSKSPISEWCEDTAECARGHVCKIPGRARYGKCVGKGKGEWCEDTAECARGLWCDIPGRARFGKCVSKLKAKGEWCQKTAECAQGLECMRWGREGFGKCLTERKSQYFWLVRFGPKVGQIRLILDKFVFFLNRTKMKCV